MSTPLANERRRPSASATVDRHVHQQVPPKVEYSLTPLGRELEPMLYAMHAWGEKLENNSNKAASRRRL
jgi:DNA-binding HxlR family transcriptional regulator